MSSLLPRFRESGATSRVLPPLPQTSASGVAIEDFPEPVSRRSDPAPRSRDENRDGALKRVLRRAEHRDPAPGSTSEGRRSPKVPFIHEMPGSDSEHADGESRRVRAIETGPRSPVRRERTQQPIPSLLGRLTTPSARGSFFEGARDPEKISAKVSAKGPAKSSAADRAGEPVKDHGAPIRANAEARRRANDDRAIEEMLDYLERRWGRLEASPRRSFVESGTAPARGGEEATYPDAPHFFGGFIPNLTLPRIKAATQKAAVGLLARGWNTLPRRLRRLWLPLLQMAGVIGVSTTATAWVAQETAIVGGSLPVVIEPAARPGESFGFRRPSRAARVFLRPEATSRYGPAVPNRGEYHAFEPEFGVASWYGYDHIGRRTADGGWFDPEAMTAAHKTLPFGSQVRVTRLDTKQSIIVEINDRGPYIEGRIIDLAREPAARLGLLEDGIARCEIEVLRYDLGRVRQG